MGHEAVRWTRGQLPFVTPTQLLHPPNFCIRLFQIGVFGADDLRAVFSLASSPEEKCARDAAMTLGNLAVVTCNQVAITNAGSLPPLVGMLSGNPHVSCQKFAARALYRLAAHGDNKPRIVTEGALVPLVRRLRSTDAEVARCVCINTGETEDGGMMSVATYGCNHVEKSRAKTSVNMHLQRRHTRASTVRQRSLHIHKLSCTSSPFGPCGVLPENGILTACYRGK